MGSHKGQAVEDFSRAVLSEVNGTIGRKYEKISFIFTHSLVKTIMFCLSYKVYNSKIYAYNFQIITHIMGLSSKSFMDKGSMIQKVRSYEFSTLNILITNSPFVFPFNNIST